MNTALLLVVIFGAIIAAFSLWLGRKTCAAATRRAKKQAIMAELADIENAFEAADLAFQSEMSRFVRECANLSSDDLSDDSSPNLKACDPQIPRSKPPSSKSAASKPTTSKTVTPKTAAFNATSPLDVASSLPTSGPESSAKAPRPRKLPWTDRSARIAALAAQLLDSKQNSAPASHPAPSPTRRSWLNFGTRAVQFAALIVVKTLWPLVSAPRSLAAFFFIRKRPPPLVKNHPQNPAEHPAEHLVKKHAA